MPQQNYSKTTSKLVLVKFLYHLNRIILRQLQNCRSHQPYRTNLPALQFLPNDLIGSRLNGGHLGSIEYKYPVHGHNIHSLATVNYQLPRGETLFHLPLTHILESIQILSNNNPKIFKDFSACKFVLVANHRHPENIQRLFRLQICLSRKSSTTRKYSKTFWAAINSGNQQQQSTAAIAINSSNQQQQSTAATKSSDQQQQSTAATSSNYQQQQPAATINSSNQQHQPAATTNSIDQFSSYQHHFHNPRRPTLDDISVPSTGYVLLEVDLGLAARLRVQSPLPRTTFCDISIFLKLLFVIFPFFS